MEKLPTKSTLPDWTEKNQCCKRPTLFACPTASVALLIHHYYKAVQLNAFKCSKFDNYCNHSLYIKNFNESTQSGLCIKPSGKNIILKLMF